MNKTLWRYLCVIFIVMGASGLVSSPAHSQDNAFVTSVSVQGSPTFEGPVQVTVSITRTGFFSLLDVEVGIGESDGGQIVYGPGLTFPQGTNTLTTTLYAHYTATSVTVPVIAACYNGYSGGNVYPCSDPGITTSVTVGPVSMTASVSPSVVSPTGSNPLLTVIAKNANGTLIPSCQPSQYNCVSIIPGTASDCAVFDHESWDISNPNVTAQMLLALLQPEVTEICNIQLTEVTFAGTLTANISVTYQANLSSADLGPSCPRAGAENVCGSPINLTNGNTYLSATDYVLPGLGGGISVTRTWNSQWPVYSPWVVAGMFGDSWQTNFEKNLQVLSGGKQLRYWRGDGSAWFFTQSQNTWTLISPADERATLTYSSKNGYTLTLRDGSVELYNANGFLTALQDRNGNKTTLTYDGTTYNRISKVTDAAGRILQFNYGNSLLPKQATSIQDSVGVIGNYTYDSGSHLLSVTYADGSAVNYGYDASGLLLAATDQQGKLLESHTYDSLRRGTSSSRANGVDALTISYDQTSANAAATLVDSKNNSTYYWAQTRVGNRFYLSQINGYGCDSCLGRNYQYFSYDGNGNRNSSTDPNNNVANYSYDSNGNVTQVSRPSSSGTQAWQYTWNSFGEILTATDPLSKATTNTYDTKGNLLTTKTPLGNTTTFTYDTKGQLLTIKDPRLNVTTLTYTAAGLLASIKDAQNNLTQFQYDARGNRTTVIDALNQTTTYNYDNMNRLTKIIYPTTPSTNLQFGYDYRGRRTSVTDANNNVTQYAYDDADRLYSVTDANLKTTGYVYDSENNLTSITDASQNQTSFSYDPLGRLKQTTFPSTIAETYDYDPNGNLLHKTDRNGHLITYTYDQLNRLTQKAYPDSTTVAYTYDLANHLTQVVDPTGSYGFTFDADGRLTQASTQYSFVSGKTFTVGYGYDAAANRTSMTDPQNAATSYVYDTLNRLQTLTSPQGAFGFTYDALSRRSQLTRPNSVTTTYSYDPVSRLLSVLHKLGSTTLDGASYTVDNAGNRTAKTDQRTGVATRYGYDSIYQLLSGSQGGSSTESYTYDPVGNRLTALAGSSAYNSSNEITSSPTATFTYDNNGNSLSKTDSTGTTSYAWDFENRLTNVTLPGSGGAVSFKYDPFARRIQKSSTGGTTNYLYDGSNSLEEVDASGNLVARYTQTQNIDEPLAMLRSGTTSFYNADGLGSITSLSDSSGALAATYTFDSFGNQAASTGTLTNPFRYTARELDSETNLYYYRARYYDPATGRLPSEDPLEFSAGTNFYAYVGNNPTNANDPSGLWSPQAHDKILAHALAGCASGCEIARLQKASRDFDKRTGGAIGFAPMHSMRAPWQSPQEALHIRDQFIQVTLAQAVGAKAAGNTGQALDLLAEALHPIMDSTSLLHTNPNGDPLVWNGLRNIDDYFHSPGDWWGAETSNMLAFGFPRFNKMEEMIRDDYIKVLGGCKSVH